MTKTKEELLQVKNLKAHLLSKEGPIKVVNGINLKIRRAETLGLVGETGAGKTVTALSILGILQPLGEGKPLWEIQGEIWFKGRDLMKLPNEETRKLRGTEISWIPQNPIASLNPMDIIGYQTGEAVEAHQRLELERRKIESEKIMEMVVKHLGKVEISDAKKRYHHFRNQFSGGEGQRILIAMALIRNPSLLIADEPTSALDVTVQRQILELLKEMKAQFNLSMLLITHSLGVIAEMSDYVSVMYAGKIMEHGDVVTIFKDPKHPYTKGLMATITRIDAQEPLSQLEGIPGEHPDPRYPISGCKFHPRCKYAKRICKQKEPQTIEIKPEHTVACWRVDDM